MKYWLLLAFAVLIKTSCPAQKRNNKQKEKAKPVLTAAAVYSNDVNYYGQAAEQRLPYMFVYTNVKLPNGVFAYADAYKLLNIGTGGSAGDLGVGFQYEMTKKITGSIDYSHSFYPQNSPVLQAANTNFISNSFDFDWGKFNTGFTADYAFGVENDVFLSVANSKAFNLGSLIEDTDYLSFEPAFTLIAGTQRFYKTYYKTVVNKPGKGGKKNGGKKETTTTVENKVKAKRFDMLSYNFKLPVSYNKPHYTIEAAYELAILGSNVEAISRRPNSFFNLSVYYSF